MWITNSLHILQERGIMPDTPVPRRYVRKLLQLAAAQGLDPKAMLAASGIFAPDTVTASSYSRLYRQLCRELADECFGFYPVQPLPCGNVELLCRVLLSGHDLEEAIALTQRFFSLRGPLRTFSEEARPDWTPDSQLIGLVHPPVDPGAVAQVFALQNGIAGALSAWHRLLGWLVGTDIPLRQVSLRGHSAINLDKFERIFRCPIQFGAPLDAVWFHADWHHRRVVRDPSELREFLRLAPYYLIARREADAERPLTLADQVGGLLAPEAGGEIPDLATTARLLGLSPRTLRRRLEAEGTSFQQLKNDQRCRLAQQPLSESSVSVQTIAERCGFEEASAFHRAFRHWSGVTPGQFRSGNPAANGGL